MFYLSILQISTAHELLIDRRLCRRHVIPIVKSFGKTGSGMTDIKIGLLDTNPSVDQMLANSENWSGG